MYKFISYQNAVNFANRAIKPMMIIQGDDSNFWVVTMAKGEKLVSRGYEAV